MTEKAMEKAMENTGLCAQCVHVRWIESSKGSVFVFCELSKTDSAFPKYPRLPVFACPGYQKDSETRTRPQ